MYNLMVSWYVSYLANKFLHLSVSVLLQLFLFHFFLYIFLKKHDIFLTILVPNLFPCFSLHFPFVS